MTSQSIFFQYIEEHIMETILEFEGPWNQLGNPLFPRVRCADDISTGIGPFEGVLIENAVTGVNNLVRRNLAISPGLFKPLLTPKRTLEPLFIISDGDKFFRFIVQPGHPTLGAQKHLPVMAATVDDETWDTTVLINEYSVEEDQEGGILIATRVVRFNVQGAVLIDGAYVTDNNGKVEFYLNQ